MYDVTSGCFFEEWKVLEWGAKSAGGCFKPRAWPKVNDGMWKVRIGRGTIENDAVRLDIHNKLWQQPELLIQQDPHTLETQGYYY